MSEPAVPSNGPRNTHAVQKNELDVQVNELVNEQGEPGNVPDVSTFASMIVNGGLILSDWSASKSKHDVLRRRGYSVRSKR